MGRRRLTSCLTLSKWRSKDMQASELHQHIDANADANQDALQWMETGCTARERWIITDIAGDDGLTYPATGELKNCSRQRVVGSNPTAGTSDYPLWLRRPVLLFPGARPQERPLLHGLSRLPLHPHPLSACRPHARP